MYVREQVSWPSAMWDPQTDVEFYRYLSGSWRDGSPYTEGGTGYIWEITTGLSMHFLVIQ
jgi:hypothetical protein